MCIQPIFLWLAEYLGQDRKECFFHSAWRLRVNGGKTQGQKSGDCGIYTSTHAMCLAFGYNISGVPADHKEKIIGRRRRYVQDLLLRGYTLYNAENPDSPNRQYYPLLDTPPSTAGFSKIPDYIIDSLPDSARRRNPCYTWCQTKAQLGMHCNRNKRFYTRLQGRQSVRAKKNFGKFYRVG